MATMSSSRIPRRPTPTGPPKSAIFFRPEPAGLFYLEHFAGDGLGKAPCLSGRLALVHHQGMELDVADLLLPDLPPISAFAWRPSWQKMASTLNRRAAN
jgi:hypothetical protein